MDRGFISASAAATSEAIRDCLLWKLPFAKRLEQRRQNAVRKDGNPPSATAVRARPEFLVHRRGYGPEIVSAVAINPNYANLGLIDGQLAAAEVSPFGDSRHLCSSLICSTARLSTVSCSRRSRRHNSISSDDWTSAKSCLIMNINTITIRWAAVRDQ